MNTIEESWKHIALRVLVISGVGILVGFIFYRGHVIIPTMRSFQFTESSITAGLAYAFWKSSTTRNVFAALFIWYVLATGLFVEFNWWLPILHLAYIGGITASIYLYNIVVKRYARRAILRIIFAGAIIAVANGFILIVLSLFRFDAAISHLTTRLEWANRNMELGAIIGLAIGIGIEIAEYLNGKFIEHEHSIEEEVVHKPR